MIPITATIIIEAWRGPHLFGANILLIAGVDDPDNDGAGKLETALVSADAAMTSHIIEAGHELTAR